MFISKYWWKILFGTDQTGAWRGISSVVEADREFEEEGHVMVDHVHMKILIPPKYAESRWWSLSRDKVRSMLPVPTEAKQELCRPNSWYREDFYLNYGQG